MVASCKVTSCKVASCKVASCMGIPQAVRIRVNQRLANSLPLFCLRNPVLHGLGFTKTLHDKHTFHSVHTLKGQCHEIFDPQFFSSNNPIKAPD
jgi:hypothetical protein